MKIIIFMNDNRELLFYRRTGEMTERRSLDWSPLDNKKSQPLINEVCMDGQKNFGEEIEFIVKIPRTMDLRIAEEINRRHQEFVEKEIKRFTLALRDAER